MLFRWILHFEHAADRSKKNRLTTKSGKNSLENSSEFGYTCVCLNARSIVNKRNELTIMLGDIELHIIRITESWVTTDISDAELGMAGYVMFKKESIGRTGDGFILYIKKIHPGL